jgi:triosephosphate isomerase (TIM)
MMRTKIVAGNWKMNQLYQDGILLAGEILAGMHKGIATRSGIQPLVVLAPPFHLLKGVAEITAKAVGIYTAAQNAGSEKSGAFTGEVSPAMVASTGASWVILGHSERRTLFGEKDELLARKLDLSLDASLTPIFCVGELLNQRLDNVHFEVVKQQLLKGVFHLDADRMKKIVIAYEPVWAIGTGHTASPEQAAEMHSFIRVCIQEKYGSEVSDVVPVLYGGSCKPDNAAELFAIPDVDGGLIGGASLKASDFLAIIKSI